MNNCCDEHGTCRQHDNCQARKERIDRVRKLAKESREHFGLLEKIGPLILAALTLAAVFVGSLYHDAVRSVT